MRTIISLLSISISLILISSTIYAQTLLFFEDFGTGCNQGTLADGWSGINGNWTVAQTGNNGAEKNEFFVSATADGTRAGNCSETCANSTSQSLHIGADDGITTSDPGASYNAGGLCPIFAWLE